MEQALDTIGEHFVQATFFSDQFKKEFSFFVKVVLRQKKVKENTNKRSNVDKKAEQTAKWNVKIKAWHFIIH